MRSKLLYKEDSCYEAMVKLPEIRFTDKHLSTHNLSIASNFDSLAKHSPSKETCFLSPKNTIQVKGIMKRLRRCAVSLYKLQTKFPKKILIVHLNINSLK